MTGGRRNTWTRRSGPLTCSRCSHADEIGLVLSADGKQLLCHECLLLEQRRAERHGKNVLAPERPA
jgi:late competence protein required for DNA uptake (superfamily II DNA/RNA helicase)